MLKIFSLQDKLVELESLSEITTVPTWIDITKITTQEAQALKERFDLYPLTVTDLSTIRTRIKVEQFPKYLFCVFYSVQKTKGLKTLEADTILSKHLLITNHIYDIPAVSYLHQDHKKLEFLMRKGVDFLFYHLLDEAVDSFFPKLDGIDDEIEKTEKLIIKKVSSKVLQRITSLRKRIIYLKKLTIALREKISLLTKGDSPFISKKTTPYFKDVHNNSIRI